MALRIGIFVEIVATFITTDQLETIYMLCA